MTIEVNQKELDEQLQHSKDLSFRLKLAFHDINMVLKSLVGITDESNSIVANSLDPEEEKTE